MKNVLLLLYFLLTTQIALPQSQSLDSKLQKLAVEKNLDKKVDLIISIWETGFDRDPYLLIQTGQALLVQAKKYNGILEEASAYCIIGTGYRLSGSPIRALQ